MTILIFWFIHQLIQPAALLIKSIEQILSRDLLNWIIRALKVLIIILGFAFKANTNDTRESAAISICKDLIDEGAYLLIYDPKVNPEQIESDLQIKQKRFFNNKNSLNEQLGGWEFCQNLEVFDNAHAALILTEWEEFKNINWGNVSKKMAQPAWIIDSRSIVNLKKVKEAGLNMWRLGDGSQNDGVGF